jgi:hypothetical protein
VLIFKSHFGNHVPIKLFVPTRHVHEQCTEVVVWWIRNMIVLG